MIFGQEHKIVHGLLAVDDSYEQNTQAPVTIPINMEHFGHATFVLHEAVGTTGTVTVTVQSCDNTTPDTTTAIAFNYMEMNPTAAVLSAGVANDTWGDLKAATTAGFGTTAGSGHIYLIEVDADGLSGTDQYVRLLMTQLVNASVIAGVLVILSEPEFSIDGSDWPGVLV